MMFWSLARKRFASRRPTICKSPIIISVLRRGQCNLLWHNGRYISKAEQEPPPWICRLVEQDYPVIKLQNHSFSSQWNRNRCRSVSCKWHEDEETKPRIEVKIISEDYIKPASPTPHHLRIYKVSILDQLMTHVYVPFVYFYPSNHNTMLDEVISERRQNLKQSLTQSLAHFYPLAGKVKDDSHIECNDDGVYYVEARVSTELSSFLRQPQNTLIHPLLPFHPSSAELFSKAHVVMIQVNVFSCGGMAIGVYTSHKIVDALSHLEFVKAWAAMARRSPEQIYPNFVAPYLFPPNSALPKDAFLVSWPVPLKKNKYVTRRFVFDGPSLDALKTKVSENPSRVMVVTALIWKCFLAALRERNVCAKKSILLIPVNLRTRNSTPLPSPSIGNLLWIAAAQCMSNDDPELHLLVKHLQHAIAKINSDFIEEIKGQQGSIKVLEYLRELQEIYSDENANYFVISSSCNGGRYEADFGWGKPIWSCIGNAEIDYSTLTNMLLLMDTRAGDGIEAWVTLSVQVMTVFQQDPELLSFASSNPSPLESI